MKSRFGPAPWLAAACLSFLLFAVTVRQQEEGVRPGVDAGMEVSLPVPVQIATALGDRYLAANMGVFRTVVASTEKMSAEDFSTQARIQVDTAWLNPAHEDNYYLAAAILPWNAQVQAAQQVLARATEARPFDWQPPFYFAFGEFYFNKDPAKGAEWLRRAASHSRDEGEILAFQQIAAQWASKGPDVEFAIRLHRDMAQRTKHKEFAAYLEKRVGRLENLRDIDLAIRRFRGRFPDGPVGIQDLLRSGALTKLPQDPFGAVYFVDEGRATFREPGGH